jgi:hypothetical protein
MSKMMMDLVAFGCLYSSIKNTCYSPLKKIL